MNMSNFEIPQFAAEIINRLEAAGYESWLVGGCVRDSLLHRRPNDWDIATAARPDEVMSAFEKTVPTGIKFGTVTVLLDCGRAEVTTMRSESDYEDFRRPSSVSFGNNITADLSRRDFTVNAIAYHHERGMFDPYGGLNDLKSNIIRAVGEPSQRFHEDALRIFRAFRFAAQLGFTIEPQTLSAASQCSCLVKNVSGERIKTELDKTLLSGMPHKIYELVNTGALCYLGLTSPQNKVNIGKIPAVLPLRWTAFLHCCCKTESPAKVMERLRFDTRTKSCILRFINELKLQLPQNPAELKRRLSNGMKPDGYSQFLALYSIITGQCTQNQCIMLDNILEKHEPYCLSMLTVDGSDLISAGIGEGPQCGRILKELLEIVIENPTLNKKEKLIGLAEKIEHYSISS